MTGIAEKCRIAGGFGVSIARHLMQVKDEILQADLSCTVTPHGSHLQNSQTSTTLFPNPMSGNFHISLPGEVESAKIELIDIFGRAVKSWEISNSALFSSGRLALPNGAYFVKVSIIGQKPTIHRLIISN